ncbi:LytR/AlgR family response regulator transcription factor [Bifidobacterium oedipodis]|uniref:DNA-binding response regulator n=1 Tax=Bifidobacterium oedipodis TaxID=2675322 RepID=A0A7Y0ERC9_9BIFI|nr:LytTR family DNA-binding domain-containing protein [Bifidobacterium sp. DSM 109957]NMM95031.1 DNA-binding response regulator [Bifidobacterium sp. DSM 109957]
MLHIAIVEDSPIDQEHLCRILESYANDIALQYQISMFANADMFLDRYRPVWDLIFMDIEMPGLDGMSAARQLRNMDEDVPLVFLTHVASLATDGYDVNALSYIIKPVSPEVFALKMRNVLNHINRRDKAYVTITGRSGTMRVTVDSISYVEVSKHSLIFHTSQGNAVAYGTLKAVEEQLSPHGFLRCGQSFLVNPRHVSGIHGDEALVGGERLPISRARKREFMEALTAYLGSMQ